MHDPTQQNANDNRIADLNRKASRVVGGLFLAIVGFALYTGRDSLELPDRNKLWADYWKKELSKPSGLPEMKSVFESEDMKIDPESLKPGFFINSEDFQLNSFPSSNDSESRPRVRSRPTKSRR